MKTIKTISLTFCLFLIPCLFVQAKSDHKPEMTREYVLHRYIQCIAHGEVDGISQLFDDNFEEFILLQEKTVIFSKKQVVEFFKSKKGMVLDCITDFSFIERNDEVAIAKVAMKFQNFIRFNYVTLKRMGDGWKITNVSSSYR